MSGKGQKGYDISFQEHNNKKMTNLVSEIDTLLEHYKLAESMYPYENLQSANNVKSTF